MHQRVRFWALAKGFPDEDFPIARVGLFRIVESKVFTTINRLMELWPSAA